MKQSKMFSHTLKSSKDFETANATLLTKAGFVDQIMAGVYAYLPLGVKVISKISKIVREEMDKIGTEVYLPALSPLSNWELTGRLNTVDVLMKTSGANEISKRKSTNEYILNCTHEDVITPIVQKFNFTYKSLPTAVYQIQSKYRNEARAKSGLLRGREFIMKDLYSFHTSEESLLDYYFNKAIPAYKKVFERIGIGDETVIAVASGGDFTDKYSHEFQTKCETGEDWIFYDKKLNQYFNKEVTPSKAPNILQDAQMQPMQEVYGEHIVGMKELVEFLKVPAEKCMKTLLFRADGTRIIAAGVRGNYDIDEEKLKKIVKAKKLEMLDEVTLKEVTGAEVGYAGIIGLPENVEIYVDESMENAINFECGANKTNYHNINVNWERDVKKPSKFYDIKIAMSGDLNPETGEVYEVFKASEVGNVFPLNTKFSDAFGYKYMAEDGTEKQVYMGSYGIGISRLMGIVVEKFHDEKGIIWPESIAPYKVHLLGLNLEDEAIKAKAEDIYARLNDLGIEVLYDDRQEVMPGEKFADSDLIGLPYRVVVSRKTADKIEVKKRTEKESKLVDFEEFKEILNVRN
jgi:prolyl-tRNA synthetase